MRLSLGSITIEVMNRITLALLLCALSTAFSSTGKAQTSSFPVELAQKIQYVIVLYPENRSFDAVYGLFPGANGLANAPLAQIRQTDRQGNVLAFLPQALNGTPDPRFPPTATTDRFGNSISSLLAPAPNNTYLANFYFDLNRFVAPDQLTGDMIHRFYTEQYQINRTSDPKNSGGSPMSKYAAWGDNPGLLMGYFDAQNLGEGLVAKEFTIGDNAFHSAFGGSFLNHFWLIAARTPVWPAAPLTGTGSAPNPASATVFDANGFPAIVSNALSDGAITNDPTLPGFSNSNAAQTLKPGDYWAVNTLQPFNGPATAGVASRLPLQTFDTIGDRLTAGNVSWAWFSGGWNDAKAGNADPLFQYHHQPFAFFQKYALAQAPTQTSSSAAGIPGVDSAGSAKYLKDEKDFRAALASGTLPQVSFVKPIGRDNYHPGYANLLNGQNWVADIMTQIRQSPLWGTIAVFITPDENGGQWDHVAPPQIDAWGPGTRVPLIVASPYAKRGFVDHTQYETNSILKFIEQRWNLPALNTRDANANAPVNSFILNSNSRLVNLSGRAQVTSGSAAVTSGFVIQGSVAKNVLVRAVGPTLASLGVQGVLSTPSLTVFNSAGAVIGSNSGWETATNSAAIRQSSIQVGAFPLLEGNGDDALLLNLAPGAYTAQVTGMSNNGSVLIEVYDADSLSSASRLVNVSCRAQVSGNNGIVNGMVINGTGPKLILIRAVGPTLAKLGISSPLASPVLQLYNGGGGMIASNVGWTNASNVTDISALTSKTGAFALTAGSTDSAMLVMLNPGSYTLQITGANGASGTALLEAYEVP